MAPGGRLFCMNKQAEGLSGEQLGRLRRVLHSPILTPSDAEYERARHVWNGMIDRKPLVIVRPTSISDVIQSVRFARDHGIAASVRGGGHSAAGKAVADGARSKPSHSLSNTLQVLADRKEASVGTT